MNNYKKFIHISKNFVPAVKIENHLNDTDKLKGYIPTKQSIDIIRNFCINENGSNVIIGPYGSGKSHLITLIANIMSNEYKTGDYQEFSNRIANVDRETSELFNKRIKLGGKRFVIIPSYTSRDFEQAMLVGISKALKREGYADIVIKSSFLKVIDEIGNWEKNFPETYSEFKNILKTEYFINKDDFIKEIKDFNKEYYQLFVEIYPRITSGANFFHYDDKNLVEILKETNLKMMEYGYTGTDIIFDEFGSFLENNIDRVNIALIQDIAETANDNENKMSFYLITHKDLSQYSRKISNEIVTEWRKVEGRFRRFTLEQSPTDVYEILSNVIVKQERFDEFFNINKDKFMYMNEKALSVPTFKELSEEEIFEYIIKGCFPLSPLSAFALYKLTNKVAQSNRTLFTFLISNDENSLGEFIDDNKGMFWVNGALIYDYFEQSIWSESRESNLYKIWQEVSSGINKANNKQIHIEIIKVIGLIYIIDDFDRLKPNGENISLLLPDYNEKEINIALEELVERKIILYRKIYGYYKFYEGSDLDLQEYIEDIIEENREKINSIDILNQYFLPLPIIPRRHNDKYCTNRYMECRFIKAEDLSFQAAREELENGFKDGIVYYVIPESEKEIKEILKSRGAYKNISNAIILLPRTTVFIENIAFKYWAILSALDDEELLETEHFLKNELFLYEEELSREIEFILSSYFNNEFKNVYVINNGEVLSNVENRYTLQKQASSIMDEHYKYTIEINNEMVNKNKLTPTMKSVSRRVINKLWDSIQNNNEIDFREFSAEDTLIRTVFINTDLIILDENNRAQIIYNNLPENHNLRLVFNEMEKYLELCRQEAQNFNNLYKVLKAEPYGLKDGLIPLLFSIAIIDNLDNIFIKKNEVYEDLDGKLLINMVEAPEKYLISIDIWDYEKENYILELESMFKDYIDYEYRSKNRLGSLYKGIRRYYIGLPKFTRETSLVSKDTQRIREIMSNEYTDYKELFFNTLPGNSSYNLAVKNMKHAKDELDVFLINFERDYSKKVANIFGKSENKIENSIENWSSNLEPDTKNYMFDLRTNLFLKYIENPDEKYLRGLIKVLTGFDMEYITDEIVDEFISNLIKIKEKLEDAEGIESNLNGAIKIDISFNDMRKTKYLDDVELSSMGKMLENKIYKDINNFNYSIDEEEKAYILVKLLKEIIQ